MKTVATRSAFLSEIHNRVGDSPVCVEVGVLHGDFSSAIYDILRPVTLHLVDPWEVGADKNGKSSHYSGDIASLATAYAEGWSLEYVKRRFNHQINSRSIVLHKGYSYDWVDSFKDNYFDFIYIDACHLYDCVKADLEMFLPKLKSTGIMCGHDYAFSPEQRVEADSNNYGVIQAVDEFCENFGFKMRLHSQECDWALTKSHDW